MNPLLPVSSISQINDFENYFQLFFKIFYGSSIYRKRNNKELFFLMIDADDFQITAGGDYSVPAVGHRSGIQNASLLQLQEGEVSVVSYELVIQII